MIILGSGMEVIWCAKRLDPSVTLNITDNAEY